MYQIAVFIHILAAVIWVGGMLFLVMVLVPLSRRERKTGGAMVGLLRDSPQKFLPVAWAAMAFLVVTGIYIGWDQWGVRPGNFFPRVATSSGYCRSRQGCLSWLLPLASYMIFCWGRKYWPCLKASRPDPLSTQGKLPEFGFWRWRE